MRPFEWGVMSTSNSLAEFLAGCLVGAAVGSATAFLLAPKTGRQIRDTLAHEARRLVAKTIDLDKWDDAASAEEARNLIDNIQMIRSAGL